MAERFDRRKKMVDITIYVEGKPEDDPAVATVDSSVTFRENFYKLFSQKLLPKKFNLKIEPFGTITHVKRMLNYAKDQKINAAFLIDLDAPKEKRKERLSYYESSDVTKIFFMIQEMEAWILSQVDKIEEFGKNEHLERKKPDEHIAANPLIKNKHPEDIENPADKLNTILRQYFHENKIRRGTSKKSVKSYSKAKDAPKLIGLLELQRLMLCFDDANRLVGYISQQ